jgi:hypothetical protein
MNLEGAVSEDDGEPPPEDRIYFVSPFSMDDYQNKKYSNVLE